MQRAVSPGRTTSGASLIYTGEYAYAETAASISSRGESRLMHPPTRNRLGGGSLAADGDPAYP